ALGSETVVVEANNGIPTRSASDAKVERGTDRCSPSPDHALAAKLAAVAGPWRDADKCGDLLVGEGSEFGKLSDQGTGEVRTHAGDGPEEIILCGPDGALADPGVEIGIHLGELAFE